MDSKKIGLNDSAASSPRRLRQRGGVSSAAVATLLTSGLLAAGVGAANAQTEVPSALDAEAQVSNEAPTGVVDGASETPSVEPSPVGTIAVSPNDIEAKQEPAPPKSSSRLIEEVVVTSQKREELIQDVPISISAFSGEKLDALGVLSAEELPKITPGLTFSTSFGFTQIFLRGVGSSAFLPSADPVVPIYLDGIALVSAHAVINTLGRIQRVEVLKGPQGTLFGRNSTGGAISIITPDPGPDFSGDAVAEIGNYSTLNGNVFLNIPIVDGLAATVSGYSQEHDTFQENDAGPTADTFSRGGRAKLLWHATDDLSFNLSALYGKTSGNSGVATEVTRRAPVLSGGGLVIPPDPKLDRHYSYDVFSIVQTETKIYSGGADWKLPWFEAKLIGARQKIVEPFVQYDFDASTLPLVSFGSNDQFYKQSSAELQILSSSDTPLNEYFSWVAGAYYLKGYGGFRTIFFDVNQGGLLSFLPGSTGLINRINDLANEVGSEYIPGLTGPVRLYAGGLLETKSVSGYFQGTLHLQDMFDLSDQVNVVLGARVDRQTRGLNKTRLSLANPVNQDEIGLLKFSVPDISATQVPLKASVQWFPADDVQLYTAFARGFTSPTYNTINFFSPPDAIKAQRTDSFEIGAKTQFFDRTLTFNTAAFYIEQRNLLTAFVSLTSGGVVRFDNVPKARIRGVEFDFTWQPLPDFDPGLVLVGSASYLDAIYNDYPEGRGYDAATGLPFGPGGPVTPPLPPRDFSGNRIDRTPKYSYNLGVNQSITIGENRLELAIETNYSGSYFFDAQNEPLYGTKSFQLVDARTSYFYEPLQLEVTAFVKNVFAELYPASVVPTDFGVTQIPNDPRTYGLRLKYTF